MSAKNGMQVLDSDFPRNNTNISPMRKSPVFLGWNTLKVNEKEWVRDSPISYENPVGNN